jgi:hypothetical protein
MSRALRLPLRFLRIVLLEVSEQKQLMGKGLETIQLDIEQASEVTHCKALYFVTRVQTCTKRRAEEHGGHVHSLAL